MKKGTLSNDCKLILLGTRRAEHPPEILAHPKDISIEEKDSHLEFMCQVQGYPEPRLQFYREGQLIRCDMNHNVEYRNHGEWSLILEKIRLSDHGEYSVTAENSLGLSTRHWNVKVLPKKIENRSGRIYNAIPAVIDSVSASIYFFCLDIHSYNRNIV